MEKCFIVYDGRDIVIWLELIRWIRVSSNITDTITTHIPDNLSSKLIRLAW